MLNASNFPHFASSTKGKWAPILLRPFVGSPETLVVGVVVVFGRKFYVEAANALERLECLYGARADITTYVVDTTIAELKRDIETRGVEALHSPLTIFSGVTIGPVADGEAETLEAIARNWMKQISSLYRSDAAAEVASYNEAVVYELGQDIRPAGMSDHLSDLVFDYVKLRQPMLVNRFSREIRKGGRRQTRDSYAVKIDFSGRRLVAILAPYV